MCPRVSCGTVSETSLPGTLFHQCLLHKEKARAGEPLNEIADNRAKAGRDSGDEAKIWHQSSDRLIFSWHSKTTGIRKGGWSAGVRKGILEAGTWIPVHCEIRVGLNKWYHTGFHAPRLNGKEPNKDVVRATKAKLDAGPKEWQSVWQAESKSFCYHLLLP